MILVAVIAVVMASRGVWARSIDRDAEAAR
jgi:hypothetical protein